MNSVPAASPIERLQSFLTFRRLVFYSLSIILIWDASKVAAICYIYNATDDYYERSAAEPYTVPYWHLDKATPTLPKMYPNLMEFIPSRIIIQTPVEDCVDHSLDAYLTPLCK
jgi:hypothetical protein